MSDSEYKLDHLKFDIWRDPKGIWILDPSEHIDPKKLRHKYEMQVGKNWEHITNFSIS